MADPLPIPLGTKSHLQSLFDKLYAPFGRDPLAVPAINWTITSGGSAYLTISGVTATLVMLGTSSTQEQHFNLVNDGNGNRPILSDFISWLSQQLIAFFGAGSVSVGWHPGYSPVTGLSALVLVESYTSSGYPIQIATSLNYLQFRVMSLVFDLMSSDTENFFTHLSIVGLDNYSPNPNIGMWLDWVGNFYGIKRFIKGNIVEANDNYRRRLLRILSSPHENNVAIASIVGQSIGLWDVLVVDYTPFAALLIVLGTPSDSTIALSTAKSMAPAGIQWSGIRIPSRGGNFNGATVGKVRAGNTTFREGWNQGTTPTDRSNGYWRDSVALPINGVFEVLR